MINGYVVGILGRLFFSVLSGVIFFGQYAADYGMQPFTYSLAYNGLYIGSEGILTIALLSVPAVRHALKRIKYMANESDVRDHFSEAA